MAALRDVSCFLRLDVMMNMCILYLNAQLDECDFGFGLWPKLAVGIKQPHGQYETTIYRLENNIHLI